MVMLLSDWYLDRREKRIQTAKAEGKTEGKAEVYREISDSASETVTREVAEARGPRRTGLAAEARGPRRTDACRRGTGTSANRCLPPRHGDLGEQVLAA